MSSSKLLAAGACALAAGVGLAACGGGSATKPTSIPVSKASAQARAELASIVSSRTAQFTVSLTSDAITTTRSGIVINPRKLVEGLQLVVSESADNPNGTLAKAGKNVSSEISVKYGSDVLVNLIILGTSQLYFYLPSSLPSSLPLKLSASDQQTVSQALSFAGGKWFELPPSFLKSVSKRVTKLGASGPSGVSGLFGASGVSGLFGASGVSGQLAQDESLGLKLEQELEQASTFTTSTAANGDHVLTVSGSFAHVANAILPTLAKLGSVLGEPVPTTIPPADANGTYSAALIGSGSTLTSMSLDLTFEGENANALVDVAHASSVVAAPAGATQLPPSLLSGILPSI